MESPVVVGVDGSAESLAAAEWAAREAARRGVALRLLHVRGRHPGQGGGTDTATTVDRRLAPRVLERAAERVHAVLPDVRVHEVQADGPAAVALVRAAEDADPLVLGSRGLGRVAGLLTGSVSLGVVARATRPVVLVRPDAGGDARRDVVVGVDVIGTCDELLAYAFEAARRHRARLRALHA
ncbi:universal stress protein, partial [Streptomyces sp. NRRL F-5527]|uniref:universal stress protein n=1 Tax=Streptomyces sp. NRRL F-5527 TaxID=1463862 RepID=UPI0004C4DB19